MNDLKIIHHLIHLDGEKFSDGEVIDMIDTYISLRDGTWGESNAVPRLSEQEAYEEIMARYDFPGIQ